MKIPNTYDKHTAFFCYIKYITRRGNLKQKPFFVTKSKNAIKSYQRLFLVVTEVLKLLIQSGLIGFLIIVFFGFG